MSLLVGGCTAPIAADGTRAVDVVTVLILAATGGIVLWYTIETSRLRKAAHQQIEVQIRPFLTLRWEHDDRKLYVSNIGRGVARRIVARQTDITVADDSSTRVVVRWDAIDYLPSNGSERPLDGRSFVVTRAEETELSDRERAWASNFGRHGKHEHQIVIDYADVAGNAYTAAFRVYQGHATVEYDRPSG
jgi:hypothetical protein